MPSPTPFATEPSQAGAGERSPQPKKKEIILAEIRKTRPCQ